MNMEKKWLEIVVKLQFTCRKFWGPPSIFKIVHKYNKVLCMPHDMILFFVKKFRPHLSKVTKHFSKIRHTPHAILRCFDKTEKNGT